MVGRVAEQETLAKILRKDDSSFLAITGRRRIGKTYLIDHYFEKHMCFRMTGIQDVSIETQLRNFSSKLSEYSNSNVALPIENWQQAFIELKAYLNSLDKKSKQVIFIDELPWIATARSGFLKLLAHLWNDYLSKEKHFTLVVCGSASSWITRRIMNDTGGLHNRLTDLIILKPFTLSETKEFLESKKLNLTIHEIAKFYMTFGGVPYYLEQIRKGENSTVGIERICFSREGILVNEYRNLYRALFRNASNHEAIVSVLAMKPGGLDRKGIILKSKVKSGGAYDRTIEDLLLSGFITEFIPFGKKKRGVVYRLNDEFSIFYHKFMKSNSNYSKGMWSQLSASQSYKIWTGYAFENLCLNHVDALKRKIGISGVYTEQSSYRLAKGSKGKGIQVDLLIDRKDDVINLCEMKYYGGTFTIDKKYANYLTERKQRFIEHTGTKKQVFTTMITNRGLAENEYQQEVVDESIELEDLFKV